jgi:hypothetical protein
MICLLDFTTIMRLSFYHIYEFYILPQLCESMEWFCHGELLAQKTFVIKPDTKQSNSNSPLALS